MLIIGDTSNQVVIREPFLRECYAIYLEALNGWVGKLGREINSVADQAKEGSLQRSFIRETHDKTQVKLLALGNLVQHVGTIMKSDDTVKATNALFQGAIAESVATNQPAEHLNAMMDLLGKTYVAADLSDQTEKVDGLAEVLKCKEIIFAMTKALTTGAPNTLGKAARNGATIEQLGFMQGGLKDFQGELMVLMDFVYNTDPDAPVPPAYAPEFAPATA